MPRIHGRFCTTDLHNNHESPSILLAIELAIKAWRILEIDKTNLLSSSRCFQFGQMELYCDM